MFAEIVLPCESDIPRGADLGGKVVSSFGRFELGGFESESESDESSMHSILLNLLRIIGFDVDGTGLAGFGMV